MPSVISHAAVAIGAGVALAPRDVPDRFWPIAILCSVLPDLDVLAFSLNIPYGHAFGHRGFFHSLPFALLLSLAAAGLFFRDSRFWVLYWFLLFLVCASHGILDALTDGGLGIALFSPFDQKRYFFPWKPIAVSPIGIRGFFSVRGLIVMKSELLWIWLPTGLIVTLARAIRSLAPRY